MLKMPTKTLLISAAVILFAGCTTKQLPRPNAEIAELRAKEPPAAQSLPNPVKGKCFDDTWGAARSQGRRHEGVDIFAKKKHADTQYDVRYRNQNRAQPIEWQSHRYTRTGRMALLCPPQQIRQRPPVRPRERRAGYRLCRQNRKRQNHARPFALRRVSGTRCSESVSVD